MLAIIPARAGSKGITNKNKRIFCGRPLIEWTIEAAKNSKSVTSIMITTDDSDLLNSKFVNDNSDFLINRPSAISSDNSPAIDYIKHALNQINEGKKFDYFCILQPTSPLREANDIDILFDKVIQSKSNCGVTVVEVPHIFSPNSLMLKNNNIVRPSNNSFFGKNLRQTKESYVARNGAAVYVCKVDYFKEHETLFDHEMPYHLMP